MLVKPEILELMKDKREEERRTSSFEGLDLGGASHPHMRERAGSIVRKNEEFERRKARAEKLKEADKAQEVKDPEVIKAVEAVETRQRVIEEARQVLACDIDNQKLAIQRRLAERRLRVATNQSSGSSGGKFSAQNVGKNRSLLV